MSYDTDKYAADKWDYAYNTWGEPKKRRMNEDARKVEHNSSNIEKPSITIESFKTIIEDRKDLFIWDNIPGNDQERLLDFLNRRFGSRFGIEWLKTSKIEKIDGGKIIKVFSERNFLLLRLNDDKTKVDLKFDDGRTDKFIAKMENSKLNIYDLITGYANLEITSSNVTNDSNSNFENLIKNDKNSEKIIGYAPKINCETIIREMNSNFSIKQNIIDKSSTGYVREVAHRVFAAELKESNLQTKEGQNEKFQKQYILTPTGAKCNRIFIIGTLTEKEDVGTDTDFWRGRIVDPTGVFYVTAGQYQPEAAQVLARTAPPEFIAVIGKPTIFTTKEGNVLSSIKAESIHIVDASARDRWVVETANLTAKRLAKLQGNEPDAVKAREHYSTNVEQYKAMVAMAVEGMRAQP